jgi:hypothetical protein
VLSKLLQELLKNRGHYKPPRRGEEDGHVAVTIMVVMVMGVVLLARDRQ